MRSSIIEISSFILQYLESAVSWTERESPDAPSSAQSVGIRHHAMRHPQRARTTGSEAEWQAQGVQILQA